MVLEPVEGEAGYAGILDALHEGGCDRFCRVSDGGYRVHDPFERHGVPRFRSGVQPAVAVPGEGPASEVVRGRFQRGSRRVVEAAFEERGVSDRP